MKLTKFLALSLVAASFFSQAALAERRAEYDREVTLSGKAAPGIELKLYTYSESTNRAIPEPTLDGVVWSPLKKESTTPVRVNDKGEFSVTFRTFSKGALGARYMLSVARLKIETATERGTKATDVEMVPGNPDEVSFDGSRFAAVDSLRKVTVVRARRGDGSSAGYLASKLATEPQFDKQSDILVIPNTAGKSEAKNIEIRFEEAAE